MRVLGFVTICVFSSVSAALAGPMPVLPDLPPLPTNYDHAAAGDGGAYAGVLGGYNLSGHPSFGIVLGNTVLASDLALAVEGTALIGGDGASIDAGLRASVAVTDALDVGGYLGLGYSLATQAFVVLGAGTELALNADLGLRLDYRYQHDLSGQAPAHKVLAGLVTHF